MESGIETAYLFTIDGSLEGKVWNEMTQDGRVMYERSAADFYEAAKARAKVGREHDSVAYKPADFDSDCSLKDLCGSLLRQGRSPRNDRNSRRSVSTFVAWRMQRTSMTWQTTPRSGSLQGHPVPRDNRPPSSTMRNENGLESPSTFVHVRLSLGIPIPDTSFVIFLPHLIAYSHHCWHVYSAHCHKTSGPLGSTAISPQCSLISAFETHSTSLDLHSRVNKHLY